jgi:hypothetical protein
VGGPTSAPHLGRQGGGVTAYRGLWWVVAVLVAVPGLLELVLKVSPLAAWSSAVAAGGMSSLVCVAVLAERQARAPARTVVLAGVGGALTALITVGLAELVGGGSGVLVLVLAACHPWVLRSAARRARRWWPAAGAAPTPSPSTGPGTTTTVALTGPVLLGRGDVAPATGPADPCWPEPAAMALLSNADLCWGWRTSFAALERVSPHDDLQRCLVLVGIRQRYLDEIARRDPAGFVRWLRAGARPAGDPSRYLRTGVGEPGSASSPLAHEGGSTNGTGHKPAEPGGGVA